MPNQEMGVCIARKLGVVGQRNRGRVHHHQAPHQQRQHHPDQGLVKAHVAHRQRPGLHERTALCAHRQCLVGRAGKTAQALPDGGAQTLPALGARGCTHACPPSMPTSVANSSTAAQNTSARCA